MVTLGGMYEKGTKDMATSASADDAAIRLSASEQNRRRQPARQLACMVDRKKRGVMNAPLAYVRARL